MSHPFRRKLAAHASLLATLAGIILAGSAFAQNNGRSISPAASGEPPEIVSHPAPNIVETTPTDKQLPVVAPNMTNESFRRPIAPPAAMIMSEPVRFDDLDLRTERGAGTLRTRISLTAIHVCARLAATYSVYEAQMASCTKAARQDALARADVAINNARGGSPPGKTIH